MCWLQFSRVKCMYGGCTWKLLSSVCRLLNYIFGFFHSFMSFRYFPTYIFDFSSKYLCRENAQKTLNYHCNGPRYYIYLTDPVEPGLFYNHVPLLLNNLLINWVGDPFVQNIQDTVYLKPEELESWKFERMCTPNHVSHVMCHISCVYLTCHVSGVRC